MHFKVINNIIILLIVNFRRISAFSYMKNAQNNVLKHHIKMINDPPSGYIQEIRSAARMGNAEKLDELTKPYKSHVILNDKIGDFMGLTPLHWAIASGQAKGRMACVEILIDRGADIEAVNNNGYTPLHYACATRKSECARLLIERGANIETKILSMGQTALHCTALKGDEDCMLLLIERGADINAADDNGDTPLHLSRRYGKAECEKILIDRGANIDAKNLAGEYPLDNAPLPLVNASYE